MVRMGAPAIVASVALLAPASGTPRQQAEEFPPVSCDLVDAEGDTHTIVVRVDGEPAEVAIGDVVLSAEYRSTEPGRVLVVSLEQDPGTSLEQVTYIVPGRTRLGNQFGEDGEDLTGSHEVTIDGETLRWSCAVGTGGTAEN